MTFMDFRGFTNKVWYYFGRCGVALHQAVLGSIYFNLFNNHQDFKEFLVNKLSLNENNSPSVFATSLQNRLCI